MRIGVCANDSKSWIIAAETGFDYVEYPLEKIVACTEPEFEELLSDRGKSGISVEACNCFFPAGYELYAFDPVTGMDNGNFAGILEKIRAYAELALERAHALGTKILVFGSGKSRGIPTGMMYQAAVVQMISIVRVLGEIAEKYGMKIAIEPLSGCNMITTLRDGLHFAREVNHPAVGVLNDFYHSFVNKEDVGASLEAARDLLIHAHICRFDRTMPTIADKKEILSMAEALTKVGYSGRISLEGGTKLPFDEMLKAAYEVMILVKRL